MEVVMNLNIKSIFLLLGLLGVAQVNAMTPEDVQARKELVERRLGQFRSNSVEEAQEEQRSEASKVLGKRESKVCGDVQPDRKKAKLEENQDEGDEVVDQVNLQGSKKEDMEDVAEAAVRIQPADQNQMCGFAELPPEIVLMIAGGLDFPSYVSLSQTCRYLDNFLNDEREIENFIKREIVARGHKNITGPVCSYFSECMDLFDVQPRNLEAHYNIVKSVIELRGRNLASYSDNSTIKIWNSESAECLHTLEGHTSWVNSVSELSSRNLASCSSDGTIKIWNPNSGECLRTLEGHTNIIYSVIELRDGNLASCAGDETIKIWNPECGECLRTLEGHTGVIRSVIELRDGNLASCSDDETIKIWNQESAECLRTLAGHTRRINSVIELSNGNLASCSSQDGTIRIWNPNSGECLRTLRGHTDAVTSVIELRDGNLASGSADRTIKIWSIYPKDLSAQQIYLVLRLDLCARHNDTIRLDDFWAEIFNSLPDYLKNRYQNAVE